MLYYKHAVRHSTLHWPVPDLPKERDGRGRCKEGARATCRARTHPFSKPSLATRSSAAARAIWFSSMYVSIWRARHRSQAQQCCSLSSIKTCDIYMQLGYAHYYRALLLAHTIATYLRSFRRPPRARDSWFFAPSRWCAAAPAVVGWRTGGRASRVELFHPMLSRLLCQIRPVALIPFQWRGNEMGGASQEKDFSATPRRGSRIGNLRRYWTCVPHQGFEYGVGCLCNNVSITQQTKTSHDGEII